MTDWREDLFKKYGYPAISEYGVGDGWQYLVATAAHATSTVLCCRLAQVKEKFGTLTIYVDHDFECKAPVNDDGWCAAYERLISLTDALRVSSQAVCEECGGLGFVRIGSWVRVACDRCHEARHEPAEKSIKDGNL